MSSKSPFHVDLMAVHPEVTGSCNLAIVKYPDGETTRFIVDCGLFQEKEYSTYNKDFPFEAKNIEFALVTHNHVDHIGRLPLLIKKGFEGKIYTTKATQVLSRYALADSYKVLKDVAKRNHEPQLYSETDVDKTKEHIVGYDFEVTQYINTRTKVTFFKNGHLLGAALILVQLSYPGEEDINLLFTGDYNNKNMFFDVPKLPEWVTKLPLTIIQESTYGDMNSNEITRVFEENVLGKIADDGSVLCMVFSLGRAQEILYVLKRMQDDGRLSKEIPIYFDGKLAHQYTNLYLNVEIGIRDDMKEFLPENLIFVDKNSRPAVIEDEKQKIVLTTSGMGTYGPAQVYIPAFIQRPNWLLHFTGFTTEGTLGSNLKETQIGEKVMIGALVCTKRAEVAYTTEFSAHAKADEMIEFLNQFENLRMVLVNHGEHDTKIEFSERIADEVKTKNVAILNRDFFFRIGHYGLIRQMSTKFN